MKRRILISRTCASVSAMLLQACSYSSPQRRQRVGYLSANAATSSPHRAFLQRLHELRVFSNDDVVYRGPSTDQDELRRLTLELVAASVDVIVAAGGPSQLAAADTTVDVPIVLVAGPARVSRRLVRRSERPDRNVTGVARDFDDDAMKMTQLLKQTSPRTTRIAYIYRSDNTSNESVQAARQYGRELDIEITAFGVRDLVQIDQVLGEIAAQGLDGIVTTSVLSVTDGDRGRIPRFAIAHGIPQIFGDKELMEAGGLMYFSPNYDAMQGRAAEYVDKLLRGSRPQDLPIELTTRSDFGINVETASKMQLVIPQAVRAQASQVYP